MTDRRRRRAAQADPSHEENPFAPPPEGQPDRPWQPRRPEGPEEDPRGNGDGREDEDGAPSRWGGKWSSRQPGRHSGGFGTPGGQGQGDRPNGNGGQRPGGMRWDPSDPKQRHARYALHAGIWGLFFALFSLTEIALLLGALSVYWGISGLRAKPGAQEGARGGQRPGLFGSRASGSGARASAEDVAGSDRTGGGQPDRTGSQVQVSVTPAQAAKARTTAAISGLVAGGLALAVVAGTFTLHMVYNEYFTCRQDALTQASREHCTKLLPEEVRPFLRNQG